MVVSAVLEVVTLGAVLPFLAVLISPDRVFERPVVADIAGLFGLTSADDLALPLTIAFISAALLASMVRLLVLWGSTKLSFATGVDLSLEMYRRTLYQPYSVHVSRNSSEIIGGIAAKVSTVVTGVIFPSLVLLSSMVILIAVVTLLITVDPMVACLSAIGFGGSYIAIVWVSRRRLQRNSESIAFDQTRLFKSLNEGLGGIRDVLLDGTQEIYCDMYHRADASVRKAQSSNTFISSSPRFLMEGVGMALIAGLAYGVTAQRGGLAGALPVLGALAMGAQRLIPTLQQAYSSWSTMLGSMGSLVDSLHLLEQPVPAEAWTPLPAPLPFKRGMEFHNVHFRYGSNEPWVINDVSFSIPPGSRVGIIGATGSGKSTLTDLLMGLLSPTVGEILVDGTPVRGALVRAWQRNIAHVPQSVYLADATIAENIAFGVPRHEIDMARVRYSAHQAQIGEFIERDAAGYEAMVGERGVRLSGGQRQRIGIARALYKRARILVLDEATSALDTVTEAAIIDALNRLDRGMTIIVIAHRDTTLRHCDFIVKLHDGRVLLTGSSTSVEGALS